MIETLSLNQIPCFGPNPEELGPLKQLTFIYGPNGAGKSSVARELEKQKSAALDTTIFNKEYVQQLLSGANQIPGVFVFRRGEPDALKRIDELAGSKRADGSLQSEGLIAERSRLLEGIETNLSGQSKLETDADYRRREAVWVAKKRLPIALQDAFKGFSNSKAKLVQEVLSVDASTTSESLKTQAELLAESETLSKGNAEPLERLPLLAPLGELSEGDSALLETPITSQNETSFGAFVEALKNSDWVRAGRKHFESSHGVCPFCQQEAPTHLSESLSVLFDGHYAEQLAAVQRIFEAERARSEKIDSYVMALQRLDQAEIAEVVRIAESIARAAHTRSRFVQEKIDAPSQAVTLGSLESLEIDLRNLVENINGGIDTKNEILRDKWSAKERHVNEVWRYFVHSVVAHEIGVHRDEVRAPKKALEGLRERFGTTESELTDLRSELTTLQATITSAAHTVHDINETLRGLGFLSFRIEHLEQDDTYRIIRENGQQANHSLSEGERTFISFLYFYHQLKQQHEDRAAVGKLLAVIDDPVSSLDGETLFVINLLLRELLKLCASKNGRLEQVVLLTHNAYFYKEAAYQPGRNTFGDRTYIVLRKGADGITTIRNYDKNPIRSNYTQLWDQVREAQGGSNLEHSTSLPNAMRRIIENYFKIAGNLEPESLVEEIDPQYRLACQSLLSWSNDGSHTAPWDVDFSSVSSDASTHLAAFKQIFVHTNHKAHYDMMLDATASS